MRIQQTITGPRKEKAINHIWVHLAQNLDETNASGFEWYPEFGQLMSFSTGH